MDRKMKMRMKMRIKMRMKDDESICIQEVWLVCSTVQYGTVRYSTVAQVKHCGWWA